jgi:hypothetical protein
LRTEHGALPVQRRGPGLDRRQQSADRADQSAGCDGVGVRRRRAAWRDVRVVRRDQPLRALAAGAGRRQPEGLGICQAPGLVQARRRSRAIIDS